MHKHAALSPAVQAQQQAPQGVSRTQIFEQQFGEQAYSALQAQMPDLIASVLTFKVLDSDVDAGTALGAFIFVFDGETAYVPVVLTDSEVQPLEILYAKNKDVFVPFSADWVEEIQRTAQSELGMSAELPKTVPTDVDIRNLVVPPTTGRYSYASDMRVGQALAKLAAEQFDPALWQGFNEQFAQMNGVTPGVALDQGQMDLDTLAKMYKSHVKTWSMPTDAGGQGGQEVAPQSGADTAMAQPPQPQPQPPKMASADVRRGMFLRAGELAQDLSEDMLESGVAGGLLGLGTGIYDDDYSQMGQRALHGAVGGAVGGAAGGMAGRHFGSKYFNRPNQGRDLGTIAGTLVGGIAGGRPGPGMGTPAPAYDPSMVRYAAAKTAEQSLAQMIKHALAHPAKRTPKLLQYLEEAPRGVKLAFAEVLSKNPKLLGKTARFYGQKALLQALRSQSTKTAATAKIDMTRLPGLRVADSSCNFSAFGTRSPLAYRGVMLRGYFYEDGRRTNNRAVRIQEPHDLHTAQESGVYRIYMADGGVKPALVISTPLDLLEQDMDGHPEKSPRQRTRTPQQLALFGDGRYLQTCDLHGEQITESGLEDTPLFERLFAGDRSVPRAGLGVFVAKRGVHYLATSPVTLSNLKTGTDGVVRGRLESSGGWSSKQFVIDPRAAGDRIRRLYGEDLVIIPASWRWVPLEGVCKSEDVLSSATALLEVAFNELEAAEATNVVVRDAGQDQMSIQGAEPTTKAAAIYTLAARYDIPASDAEAICKIAEVTGKADVIIAPTAALRRIREKTAHYRVKIAQHPQVQTPMQSQQPAMQQPAMQQPARQQQAPAATMDPTQAVGAAFQEMMGELSTQMQSLQAQLDVLQSVQQRALELSGQAPEGQSDMPQDPGMQSQDPAMQGGGDPAAPGMAPEGAEMPSSPMMLTETPSQMEISQQINPQYLEHAAQLNDAGTFDAGAIAELERAQRRVAPGRNSPIGDYAQDLTSTVDDLGRTLLTMQLRAQELQQQLGTDGYADLEQQVRDSFHGLGKLSLELSQNAAALTHAQALTGRA